MIGLTDPLDIGRRRAPSRVVFGPHVTNLGTGRALSERHVAYYRERAAGGAGVVVIETASVDSSDWPYERAPLAADCAAGWSAVADACRPHGTVVLAGLGHRGGQGSSAYSQSALWAPSPVADVLNREVPMVMEDPEIDALVDGFRQSAGLAVISGLDGVELDAGPTSLLRQFHSGLTNQRGDGYGADRLRLTREVLAEVRAAVGADPVVGLRLSCDELAPWAGITPEHAVAHVDALADLVDLLVVVRGGPFSRAAYRPDGHTAANFNRALCRAMRDAASGRAAVVLQGSVVDPGEAQRALDEGVADAVEMTRAQIADPRLVVRVRTGEAGRVRPCILCNQECQVDDVRNPLVSCVGEPRSGHETEEVDVDDPLAGSSTGRSALVVGAGVAGLECSRVLARHGVRVRLADRAEEPGGTTAPVGRLPGHGQFGRLVDWLVAECRAAGVQLALGEAVDPERCDEAERGGAIVVVATGSRPAPVPFDVGDNCAVVDAASVLAGGTERVPDGPVLVHDPIGGPAGVGVAELLAASGRVVAIVTPDPVAGSLLARTGDLADANVRLERAGVVRHRQSRIRSVGDGTAVLEDVWTGEHRSVPCVAVIDAGHRLPEDELPSARPHLARAGDCVAPRTVLEAVLEGRHCALEAVGRGRGVRTDAPELVA